MTKRKPPSDLLGHDANAWTGRFTCTEEADAYLSADTLHCLLCWQGGFRSLVFHLRNVHRTTTAEYRKRFVIASKRPLHGAVFDAEFLQRRKNRKDDHAALVDWEGALSALASGERLQDVLLVRGRRGSGGSRSTMPDQLTWYRRVRSDPEFARRAKQVMEGRGGVRMGEETLTKVETALKEGRSIASLRSEIGTGRFSVETLYRRKAKDPDFARRFEGLWLAPGQRSAAFLKLCSERKQLRVQVARERFAPFRAREEFRQALRSDEVYGAVYAAVSRLPHEIRDDVASDLVVAVLDGDITIADLPHAVSRFRSAHSKMFGGYGPSLDAPIGDGGFTLGQSMVAAYI